MPPLAVTLAVTVWDLAALATVTWRTWMLLSAWLLQWQMWLLWLAWLTEILRRLRVWGRLWGPPPPPPPLLWNTRRLWRPEWAGRRTWRGPSASRTASWTTTTSPTPPVCWTASPPTTVSPSSSWTSPRLAESAGAVLSARTTRVSGPDLIGRLVHTVSEIKILFSRDTAQATQSPL